MSAREVYGALNMSYTTAFPLSVPSQIKIQTKLQLLKDISSQWTTLAQIEHWKSMKQWQLQIYVQFMFISLHFRALQMWKNLATLWRTTRLKGTGQLPDGQSASAVSMVQIELQIYVPGTALNFTSRIVHFEQSVWEDTMNFFHAHLLMLLCKASLLTTGKFCQSNHLRFLFSDIWYRKLRCSFH